VSVKKVKQSGFDRVQIQGDGDIADICRLTCLEQGVKVVEQADAPRLAVNGFKVSLNLDEKKNGGDSYGG